MRKKPRVRIGGLGFSLRSAGFSVEEAQVAKHPGAKRKEHRIYLAGRRD